jgi:hypothetical protein
MDKRQKGRGFTQAERREEGPALYSISNIERHGCVRDGMDVCALQNEKHHFQAGAQPTQPRFIPYIIFTFDGYRNRSRCCLHAELCGSWCGFSFGLDLGFKSRHFSGPPLVLLSPTWLALVQLISLRGYSRSHSHSHSYPYSILGKSS